jgi:hypothetical protein
LSGELGLADIGWHVAIIPTPQCAKFGMCKVTFQISPDPRDVSQISRLAIALGQAREDAEDLGTALSAKRGVSESESVTVEPRLSRGDVCTVVIEEVGFKFGGDIGTRVLQE